MHIRTTIKLLSLIAFLCVLAFARAEDSRRLPTLRDGDVMLCQPYPYRTITNTARTIYQIARLGFVSVRAFQQAHALKADGIIGPQTQRQVEAEYRHRFCHAAATNRTELSISLQPVATSTGITAKITVRSVAAAPVRIVGTLIFDESSGFRFTDPTASLHTKISLRHGDLITSGGRKTSVALAPQETPIAGSATLPALAVGESGRIYASITYLGADLTERAADADVPIP